MAGQDSRPPALQGELTVEALDLALQSPNLPLLLAASLPQKLRFAPALNQRRRWPEGENQGSGKDLHDSRSFLKIRGKVNLKVNKT